MKTSDDLVTRFCCDGVTPTPRQAVELALDLQDARREIADYRRAKAEGRREAFQEAEKICRNCVGEILDDPLDGAEAASEVEGLAEKFRALAEKKPK
jgi:hypothetical protein